MAEDIDTERWKEKLVSSFQHLLRSSQFDESVDAQPS
jgi:hypothetical protein